MGTTIIKAILCSIFLIFFNLLFFILCGTENNSSTWISYGFIHVAYLLLLITPLFNKENKGKAILSMTLYTISLFYFFIELLVGILFICLEPENAKWTLTVHLIILALFLLVFLSSYLANIATTNQK